MDNVGQRLQEDEGWCNNLHTLRLLDFSFFASADEEERPRNRTTGFVRFLRIVITVIESDESMARRCKSDRTVHCGRKPKNLVNFVHGASKLLTQQISSKAFSNIMDVRPLAICEAVVWNLSESYNECQTETDIKTETETDKQAGRLTDWDKET
eukprot:765931-Hanusia_phi.AAC.1